MKRILYSTDFSENAERAFVYALKMAHKNKAYLIMLSVFDIPTAWDNPYAQDFNLIEKDIAQKRESMLKELYAKYTQNEKERLKVEYTAVENKSVVKGILSVIKEKKPDLLVVGTKGGSKAHEAIVGSTTKSLTILSTCPVLAIPENAVDKEFKKIVYATDFQSNEVQVIDQLMKFVQSFKPEITITHITTHQEHNSEEKMEIFRELVKTRVPYDKIKFQILLSDNIYERLNNYIKSNDIDLLVMLEKERTGVLNRFFHSDLVKKMEFHCSIPVLSFNEHYLGLEGSTDRE